MSRLTSKILLLLCLACFSLRGFGQDTALKVLPPVWDLEACLQYAKANNIQLKSLQLNKQSAQQDKLLAKSALLPDLYGSASESFNHYNMATNGSSDAFNYSGS